MVQRIEAIREPYRGNLLQWLQRFTVEPLQELDADLHRFFVGLNPAVREEFAGEARLLLEEVVYHFGVDRASRAPRPPAGQSAPS
jgi:hypothetical protein